MDSRSEAKVAKPAAPPSYAAVAAAAAPVAGSPPSAKGDGSPAAAQPSTPSRKRVSLLLTHSPTSSAPGSPLASRFGSASGGGGDDNELVGSPASGHSRRGSGQTHEYTSLSALRKANKGKAVDRGDRKNGWHLWSQEADAEGAGPVGTGGETSRRDASLGKEESEKAGKRKLSTLDMICLTAGMGGAQIAWCLEMGFGNQELLALGLSEELTSLVWLAGPISGLVTQPLIGAISDSSTSRFRRRFWIASATLVMMLSTLALAFAQPLGATIADVIWSVTGGNGKNQLGKEGDWDPAWREQARNAAIAVAVASFYGLDFAVNALQASLRNLLLDVTPAEQLSSANAWQGRMTHIGNCVGFTLGFLDLSHFPLLAWLGGGQFRKFCMVIILILGATVWLTCWTTSEVARVLELGERPTKLKDIAGNLYKVAKHLPRPIRRVCYVQIFAFMSWFPFLFYSTTWVLEVMKAEQRRQGKGAVDKDAGARAGSLAMLFYSIVAVIAGTVLPYLAERDRRLLAPETGDDDEDEDGMETEQEREFRRIKAMVEGWKLEAKLDPKGKPVRLPTMPFMLRNIWTAALVLFSVLMIATFFVTKVWEASVLISLVGICWAVASWVPFSLLMEYLKEMQEVAEQPAEAHTQADLNPRPMRLHLRTASTPGRMMDQSTGIPKLPTERSNLLKRSQSMINTTETEDHEDGERRMDSGQKGPIAGGSVLGIHNLSIVFPQFLIAIVSSLIFKAVAASHPAPSPGGGTEHAPLVADVFSVASGGGGEKEANGVAWVLRFGGVCALVAAAITRRVPPTKTEKAMRRRLAEMRMLEHDEEEEAGVYGEVVVAEPDSEIAGARPRATYGATSDRASA